MTDHAPVNHFVPFERPIRVAIIGLGRIYDLNVLAYLENPDVEVVALVDASKERQRQRQQDWPAAACFSSIDELVASGVPVDATEVLLPIALHEEGATQCLNNGWHVNLQKPVANDLASAQRLLDAARRNQRVLRVMENYLFTSPDHPQSHRRERRDR